MDIAEYKEFDFEGEQTLKAIASADKFNHWMFSSIEGFCRGRILEIGSGIGNISKFFISNESEIVLSDIRSQYRDYLESVHLNSPILDLDIVHPDFDTCYGNLLGTFDTVFALNVVEHVQDDKKAIDNMFKLLKPSGNLIVLVPAYQFLYNEFDRQLLHFRRYTLKQLFSLTPSNAKCIHSQYFNFMGIFGWFFVGGVLRKKIIPEGNMKLYNRLVPLFKLIDLIFFNKMGLSCIVVFRKSEDYV